jgi:hypothetical protein
LPHYAHTCLDHENGSGQVVEILEHASERLLSVFQIGIGIGLEELPERGVVHPSLAVGL